MKSNGDRHVSILGTFSRLIRTPDQEERQSKDVHLSWVIDALCVVVLIGYFLHFALPAIGGNLNADEMMNLWGVWQLGGLKSLWANVCFWTPVIRPGGALYYLPLYHFFGLNPKPYHIVQIGILTASIPMVYYLSYCLASSRLVAFLATFALCYHAALGNLAFVGSFIYDVLCGFFYFAALTYYIHIRERGDELHILQLAGVLTLYVCALDFKEMAVTLPVIVLIYELLKCHHWSDWKQFARWMCSCAAPALLAGALTAVYIYGKTHSPGALITLEEYRPHYSWTTFLNSNAHFVSELFYGLAISNMALLVLWAAIFLYAFLRVDRWLRLMAFWIVIVPLPLAFIPPRGGACLYLLLFGWAMIFASVASDLSTLMSWLLIGQSGGVGAATGAIIGGAAAGRVRWAAIGAAVGAAAAKMSASTFRIVAMLMVAFALAILTCWENQRLAGARGSFRQKAAHVIQGLRSLDLHPAPRSTLLLVPKEELFQNKYDKYDPIFIAYLVWNDHSLQIWLEGLTQLTPRQLAKVDYVISFSEFKAEVVRAPESHRH